MADQNIFALVDYEDSYVQPLVLAALEQTLPPEILVLIQDASELPSPTARFLQWRQYESIDFDHLLSAPHTCLANSYVIRKSLIRKHYLSNTVSHWLSKHPNSELRQHVKPSVEFEVDYAEFLDDALIEAYELHESWARNGKKSDAEKEWWILKPGMGERGQGIRLFSSEAELTAIFEEWDPPSDDEDAEDDTEQIGDEHSERESTESTTKPNGIMTSHLRHFIAQTYIQPPLLLGSPHPSAERKFHIRVYVLAVGALKVFVYKDMLALFAAHPYGSPSSSTVNESLGAHLTNTCLQSSDQREGSVHAFWSLPTSIPTLPPPIRESWQDHVWEEICKATSMVFEAAARTSSIHFQPLPNAFEIYGLDFLVDGHGGVWLLEVNAFPDFAQTGTQLEGIVEGLMRAVVRKGVLPFFGLDGYGRDEGEDDGMAQVLDLDLGRR